MFGFIRRRVDAFFLETRRFVAALKLFLAVALVVASIAGSFFVPTKALSVLISSIGCFAAGWLFAVFFATALKLGSREHDSSVSIRTREEARLKAQQAENAKLRNKLTELRAEKEQAVNAKQAENTELRNELAKLRAETKRIKDQRIDFNVWKPIFKLELAEADMSIKDVKIDWLGDFDNGHLIELDVFDNGPKRSQYIGALQRSFKATYGVDLKKLRVREDGECLRVAGIATESLGLRDDKTTWLLRQIQQVRLKQVEKNSPEKRRDDCPTGCNQGEWFYEVDREKDFTGSFDLNRIDSLTNDQIDELNKRIDNGIGEEFREFQNIKNYVQKMAQGIVEVLLAPMKKQVTFDPTPLAEIERDSNWFDIEDFVNGYNKCLDAPAEM